MRNQSNKLAFQSEKQSSPSLKIARILLAGNPNSGKTTVFNALTGLRQKVANYPGVTVEKKVGTLLSSTGLKAEIHDLPGLYSLIANSIDEQIAVDEITCRGESHSENDQADLIVVVADATNLERNLYLCTQILDLGAPTILVLNMIDEAARNEIQIDIDGLSTRLGIPVIATAAKKRIGILELREAILNQLASLEHFECGYWQMPSSIVNACQSTTLWMQANAFPKERLAFAEAIRVISHDSVLKKWNEHERFESLQNHVKTARDKLVSAHIPWRQAEAQARYTWIDQIISENVQRGSADRLAFSERIDRVLTHRVFGPIIFLGILAVIFQSVFTWAEVPMDAIDAGVAKLSEVVAEVMPDGVLQDLIVDGAITGVGAVVIFLPQILFLFFFLTILEDSGYLSRAAFMLDRFMSKIGLQGYSVIPLLSSFACAIPGIMSARTIKNPEDRLITILVAPLMSCSARLPVYALMIGAFIPSLTLFGFITLKGATLLAMYLLGMLMAVVAAYLLKRYLIKGESQSFMLELPAYRIPSLKSILWQMYERAKLFVMNAGKVILAISIVLWFLASYPKVFDEENRTVSQEITNKENPILQSYAGRLGKAIEPVIKPLGFDWKIGIGLITSFAAREVMVSTLATIYNVESADENSVNLRQAMQKERDPQTGLPVYTPLVAISLMVFFVLACQCMSTVAIVRRETDTWRWPIFMIAYMTILAYVSSLIVYQGGKLIGLS